MKENPKEESFVRDVRRILDEDIDHIPVFPAVIERKDDLTYARLGNGSPISVISELTGDVYVSIQPTDILISSNPIASSALNTGSGTIRSLRRHGPLVTVIIDIGFPLEAAVTRHSAEALELSVGKQVNVTWKASSVHVFKDTNHGTGE